MADNEETPDVDLENDADVTMEGAEADDSLAIPDIAEPPAKRIRFLEYVHFSGLRRHMLTTNKLSTLSNCTTSRWLRRQPSNHLSSSGLTHQVAIL